uniref:Uncharacterized protein n=1 Tax=Ciona savignyi TaxID=51511 RepID=H2ZIM9_CIOSA
RHSTTKDDVISTTNNDVILPPIDDVILSTNDDIIPPTISLGVNASSADGKNSSKNRGDVSPLSVLNIPPPPPNNDDIEVDQNNQDNKEKLSSPENSVNIDDVLASFDFVYQDISGNSPNTFGGDHSNQQHASHTEDKESANSEINETVSSVDILDEITKQIDSDPAFSNGTPPNDGKEHLDLNSNHNNNVVNESKAQYTHNNT